MENTIILCVISSPHRGVNEIFAFLGWLLQTFWDNLGSNAGNYKTTLHDIPEERGSHTYSNAQSRDILYNHHRLPPWIRSFDLYQYRRSFLPRGLLLRAFRESGVVHPFKVVDPVLFVFESHVLYSRNI